MTISRVFQKEFSLIIDFLENNFSSPSHWPDWNLVVSNHYKTVFFYFVAYKENTIIGICPAHRLKHGNLYYVFSGQFKFIPNGGWIFKRGFASKNISIPLSHNESFLSFGLPLIPEFNFENYKTTVQKALTLIIDLEQDINNIWKTEINSKRRNMIRKAENKGVEICNLQEKEFDLFYNIYLKGNARYGLDSMPKEMLIELFKPKKNIHFDVLLAKWEGEIQNIVVIAYDKNFACYWLGFSNENIQNYGQGDLLQWEAIKAAKAHGCKYYDLCYIEKEKLPHIYTFKKGFSQQEMVIPIISQKSLYFKIINRLTKWF